MNEKSRIQLMKLVESAVRPVQAAASRKRAMREELLAHLQTVFEEESQRLMDEKQALERATERFGDPTQISIELNAALSTWDRLSLPVESFGNQLIYTEDRSWKDIARFHAMLVVVYFIFAWCLFLIPSYFFGIPEVAWSTAPFFLAITTTMTLMFGPFTLGLTFLWYGLGHAVFDQPAGHRSMKAIGLYGLASAAFIPVLAFISMYLCSFGDLGLTLRHTGYSFLFAPLAPFLFLAPAYQWVQERRAQQEWADQAL